MEVRDCRSKTNMEEYRRIWKEYKMQLLKSVLADFKLKTFPVLIDVKINLNLHSKRLIPRPGVFSMVSKTFD